MTELRVKFYNTKLQRAQVRLESLLKLKANIERKINKNRASIHKFTERLDKEYSKAELHIRSKPIESNAFVGANIAGDISAPATVVEEPCPPTV